MSSDIGSVEVVDDLQSFPSMTDMSVISATSIKEAEYVNAQGVRFTAAENAKNGNCLGLSTAFSNPLFSKLSVCCIPRKRWSDAVRAALRQGTV